MQYKIGMRTKHGSEYFVEVTDANGNVQRLYFDFGMDATPDDETIGFSIDTDTGAITALPNVHVDVVRGTNAYLED